MRTYIGYAASVYGVNPQLLDEIAKRESTYSTSVVNTSDSNARAGHPSAGLFQFIKATFMSYAARARAANPTAWAGLGPLNWMDYRQQSLTASYAISVGGGSNWSTYGAAMQTLQSQPAGTNAGCKQSSVRSAVAAEAQRRGLRHTGGDRTPDHNAAVGGVEGSDHLTTKCSTWADDYVGTEAQMKDMGAWALATYVGHIKQVLIHDAGSGRHLHIAGFSDNGASSSTTPPTTTNVGLPGAGIIGGIGGPVAPFAQAYKQFSDWLDANPQAQKSLENSGGSIANAVGLSALGGQVQSAVNDGVQTAGKYAITSVIFLGAIAIGGALVVYGLTKFTGTSAVGTAMTIAAPEAKAASAVAGKAAK